MKLVLFLFFSLHFFLFLIKSDAFFKELYFFSFHYYARTSADNKIKKHIIESKIYWKWKLVNQANVEHVCVNFHSENENYLEIRSMNYFFHYSSCCLLLKHEPRKRSKSKPTIEKKKKKTPELRLRGLLIIKQFSFCHLAPSASLDKEI